MPTYFVGIDVSKFKHTCCILSSQGEVFKKIFDFPNSREGFDSLDATLKGLDNPDRVQILMEATGHYHENLFRFLVANHYQAQIKNPTAIARFKDSEDVGKAKTDRLDAFLIARYASGHEFLPSSSKLYNIERIRIISRAKYFLYQDKTRLINHLHRYLDESFPEVVPFFKKRDEGNRRYQGRNVFDSPTFLWLIYNFPSAAKFASARLETGEKLRKMSHGSFSLIKFNTLRNLAKRSIGVAFLETEMMIKNLVNDLQALTSKSHRLDESLFPLIDETAPQLLSIPGLGYRTAGLILGEIGDASRFPNPYKLIRYAGLDVKIYQSGTVDKRGKLGKRGSPFLRYGLFQAAEKARIHCPEFAEFYAKKKDEGKHWICALTHTARKMLRTIWALLVTRQPYSPH